jgi:hypothetical protein
MQSEFLFTVAEIAVAFAGFAGLVIAISRRQGRSAADAQLDLELLKNVLGGSLMAIAFALIPATLLGMDVKPSVAWRSSAFLYAIAFVLYMARTLPRAYASYRASSRSVPLSYRLNTGLGVVVIVCLVLC